MLDPDRTGSGTSRSLIVCVPEPVCMDPEDAFLAILTRAKQMPFNRILVVMTESGRLAKNCHIYMTVIFMALLAINMLFKFMQYQQTLFVNDKSPVFDILVTL